MAKPLTCSKCGKTQSVFGPEVKIFEKNGMDYCEDCVKTKQEISVEQATTEQKLAAIVKYIDALSKQSIEQTRQLKSINSIMIVFVILIIIGILFQGCSALNILQ